MRLVTVTTVRDEGAAQVAKEALNDRGIHVELRAERINPYFASMTAVCGMISFCARSHATVE